MDAKSAAALIQAGETFTVEFKGEEKGRLNDRDLVEAVICLANGDGGYLFIGVEDDGRVTGASPRHEAGRTDPLRVQALIANRTRPSLGCRVEELDFGGPKVLVVEVPDSIMPVGTSDGTYARRAIGAHGRPECLPYHFHEMQARQASIGFQDYTSFSLPGAAWDDLDPLEFERFRRLIRESRGLADATLADLPDLELAKSLGAVDANGTVRSVKVLGLLLFGKEASLRRLVPTHEVAFQILSGVAVEMNEFLRWPLLRAVDEIMARFRARNKEQEILVGAQRIGIPDYSERAFREGLANALIHRDYTLPGAVHVAWKDHQLEISNPGGFPEGVRLDNLLVTPPRPRNPLLADAFKRAGLVERTARGVDTIFFEQLRSGRPAPSYGRSTERTVVLSLSGGPANLEFVRLVVEESQAGRALVLDELLLLNELWLERQLTLSEAAAVIQRPESETRALLERLVELDMVEGRSAGRARSYHLSASVYRRLDDSAAYVRQRGFETLQQETMILQYLAKYGEISRSEAASLCKVSLQQAYRLLVKLAEEGRILPPKTRGRYAKYYKKPD